MDGARSLKSHRFHSMLASLAYLEDETIYTSSQKGVEKRGNLKTDLRSNKVTKMMTENGN